MDADLRAYIASTQVVKAEHKGSGWNGTEFEIEIRNCTEKGRTHTLYNEQPSYKRLIAMVNKHPWRVEVTEDGWEARKTAEPELVF